MTRNKVFLCYLLVFLVKTAESDLFYNVLNNIEPCQALCAETYSEDTVENVKYASCCRLGCRFFILVHLAEVRDPADLNVTKDDCQASCMEAYSHTKDRYACNIGCAGMANLKQGQAVVPQINWSMYVEEGNSMLVLQPVDFEPDDVLTDPGLRRQLEDNLRGGNTLLTGGDVRLPETHKRTLPVDDLGERVTGMDSSTRVHTSGDWLDCAARKVGLPRVVLASLVVFAILLAIWLCLCSDRRGGVEYVQTVPGADAKDPFDCPPKYTALVNEV